MAVEISPLDIQFNTIQFFKFRLNGVEPIKRPERTRDCTSNTVTQIKTYVVSVSTDLAPY
jgi:hypothetical protein